MSLSSFFKKKDGPAPVPAPSADGAKKVDPFGLKADKKEGDSKGDGFGLKAAPVTFSVGDNVNVEARTWSGINKPGGVGRVSKVNDDGTYNVKYALGGSEKNVDRKWIRVVDDSGGRRRPAAAPVPKKQRKPQKAPQSF